MARLSTQSRILREVRRRTVVTHSELIEVTGLSENGLWRVLRDLKDDQLLAEESSLVRLCGDLGYLVGVDVTLDRVRVVAAELDYSILGQPALRDIQIADPPGTLALLADLIVDAVERASIDPDRLVGVGIGLPGPISRRKGAPDSPHILPGWEDIPVQAELVRLLGARGLPSATVMVANDASLGALGVYTHQRLADPGSAPDDLLYVRVATGIGAGIVMKGHLVSGADGLSGEIGHIRVDPYGPLCVRCNQRGCLEQFASRPAILERIRQHAREDERPVPASLERALEVQDSKTLQEIKTGAWHLGLVLAGVTNFLNPSWIILGGRLAELGAFRTTMEETVRKYALNSSIEDLHVTTWNALNGLEPSSVNKLEPEPTPLTPELLGALAHVVDEAGDDYLLAQLPDASEAA